MTQRPGQIKDTAGVNKTSPERVKGYFFPIFHNRKLLPGHLTGETNKTFYKQLKCS